MRKFLKYLSVKCFVLHTCVGFMVAVALFTAVAHGQSVKSNLWVTNGHVRAIAKSGKTIFIGGTFTNVGPSTGTGVVLNSNSGVFDPLWPKVNGEIFAAVPDGTGGWYIGGDFTHVGGIPRNRIAHILSNKSVASWNPDADGRVTALLVFGSNVFVGGEFASIGGQQRMRVASIRISTGLAGTWNPGANGTVYALAPSSNLLYVGGDFDSIGGQSRNFIAVIDTSSSVPSKVFNASTNGPVYAIAVSDGGIYLGGNFSNIGGRTRSNLGVVGLGGQVLGYDPAPNGVVRALQLVGVANLFVAGEFTTISGVSRNRLAVLEASSPVARAWNPNANGSVTTMMVSGASVYVGGSFTTLSGQIRNYTGRIDTGGALGVWNPNTSGRVNALAVSGTNVFAGGAFGSVNGVQRNNLAAIDDNSGTATSWNPNVIGDGVDALVLSGSTLYAGGSFTTIGTQLRSGLGAISTTTGLPTSWNPNPNADVHTLARSNGIVYAGGSFTSAGGQARNRIAALDTITGNATTWNPNADDIVLTIQLSGNLVYAGGLFSTIGGQARNRIAAIDGTTGTVTSWNPNAGSGYVATFLVSGNTVYAGGGFASIGGGVRNSIAALDAISGNATPFSVTLNPQSSVASLALSGSNLYVGGFFNSSDLLSVNPLTGAQHTWDPQIKGGVSALAVADSTVFAGGGFTYVQNEYRTNFLAVIDPSLLLPGITITPATLGFDTVLVGQQKRDSVLVANTGTATLNISSATSNNPRFTVSPTNVSIAAGGNRWFVITFAPTTSGTQAGSVSIAHNATGSLSTVTVTGTGAAPGFAVAPTSLSFGNIIVGGIKQDSVTVTNTGGAVLNISNVASVHPRFSVTPTSGSIAPNGSRRFFVTFSPSDTVNINSSISFTHNGAGSPTSVGVSGRGITSGFAVNPTSLSFGAIRVGATKQDSVTVTNTGAATLNISNVSSNNGRFIVTPTSATLAPSASRKFFVSFSPDTLSSFLGSIRFIHDAAGSPTNVSISGNGVEPSFAISSRAKDFGTVVINSTVIDSVLVTNSGGFPLTISSVTSTSSPFTVFPNGAVVPPSGNLSFRISFRPNMSGTNSARIIFNHNAIGSPDSVAVSGIGITSTFFVTPTTLSFGNIKVGRTKQDSVTVSNGGTSAILVSSVVSGNPRFTVAPISADIPVSGSRRFFITYAPTAPESLSTAVTFSHNAVGSPTSVIVSGRGLAPAFRLSAQNIVFGSVSVGSTKQDTVTVLNAGTDTLTIISASMTDVRFSVSPSSASILPLQSRDFAVTFTPTAGGSFGGNLVFAHNAPGSPNTVGLSGTGTAPQLFAAPRTLLFGEVGLGSSLNLRANLVNVGNAILHINSLLLSGRNASEFAIVGPAEPFVPVAPNETLSVIVRFFPLNIVDTSKTAFMIVLSDAVGTSPDTLTLSGRARSSNVNVSISGDTLAGGQVNLTALPPQGFNATGGRLFYRVAGRRQYDSLTLSSAGQAFSARFPDSVVTLRGIEYYVVLTDNEEQISNPEIDPVNNPASVRVRVARSASPLSFEQRRYKMISVPLVLSNATIQGQLVDDFGPYNTARWRLFRWERDRNIEFDSVEARLTPGVAFWFVTQSVRSFDVEDGRSVPSGLPFTMLLQPGWNQIATPFAFPVSWESIANSRFVRPPYFWDGVQYVPGVQTLLPWEGYFVLNDSSEQITLSVSPLEATPSLPKSSALVSGRDYILQFSAVAKGSGLRDEFNYLGFAETATSGRDMLDLPEPPPIADHIQLSFIEEGMSYLANFKPPTPEGHSWGMKIRSTVPNQQITITTHEFGELPAGFDVYVLDEDWFAYVPLNGNAFTVQLEKAFSSRSFKILIGTKNFAERMSNGIPLIPMEFSLAQNYPNPFNPTTTIRYTLSRMSVVSLEIYNALGQLVRTLVHGEQVTGTYSLSWDGTNTTGCAAASGVYIYRLRAGDYVSSRKLLLLR